LTLNAVKQFRIAIGLANTLVIAVENSMKRTYFDTNILISAFQGKEQIADIALSMLLDPDRELVISDILRLEVLPKPTYHKRQHEVEFMKWILANAMLCVTCKPALVEKAIDFASHYNLHPLDALHIAAAYEAEVDEFVTLEKPTKPICQVQEIKVISIYPQTPLNE